MSSKEEVEEEEEKVIEHRNSIGKLHEEEVYKPVELALFTDANGVQLVEIIKKTGQTYTLKNKMEKTFDASRDLVKQLSPEMAQWVKNEAYSESNSTREDDVEKRNLNHQLSPNYDISEKIPCCSRICTMILCRAPRDDIRSKKFRRNVRRSINFLNITTRKKAILLDRYVSLVEAYQKTRKRYTYAYNSTRSVVTLLNILTPAFVSIQPVFGADTYYNFMYWTTFATTVISGLISSYIGLFKLDKKFYSTTQAYLRLETEGWCYFTLTGKYAKNIENPLIKVTHENQFRRFCAEVENIRRSEMKTDMVKTHYLNTKENISTVQSDNDSNRRKV